MPWIIGFGIFLAYPIFASIYFSFTEYSVLKSPVWTGAENYRTLISDDVFWQSLGNTLFFALFFVPIATFVALGLALLLNTKVKFQSIYRTVFFVPSLVPVVSMVILWLWLFNGEYGLINMILGWTNIRLSWFLWRFLAPIVLALIVFLPLKVFKRDALNRFGVSRFWLAAGAVTVFWASVVHFGAPVFSEANEWAVGLFGLSPGLNKILPQPNWLGDVHWSKPAIIFMSTWGVGNAMIIYLAGLQEVPKSLYEAADIDGASPWRKTISVTIPLLSPVIMFNVIMSLIGSLQIFTQPYVMSQDGAPARSIYFYSMYLFDNAFTYQKMGYASAMAWIMFIIIFSLTLLAIKISNKYVHYEGG